jgi:hypothetical protein
MFKWLVSATIILILVLGLTTVVLASLSIGVKKGDWIEYTVTYTGSPPKGHDINWARMEVTNIHGTNITVSITSKFPNGSTEIFNSTLNLKTGQLIDDFIIPANLKAGETFLDQNLGNVTISRAEQHTYGGALRIVLYASSNQNTYVWDQATGVSVEGTSEQPGYSMHTIIEDTNMWQPPQGLDMTISILIAVIVIIVIVAIVAFAKRYKKKVNGLIDTAE